MLSENQFGFRKGLSTGLAIFDVIKQLFENWNEKQYSGCIFVDFSRAFDSIDHNILAEKLKMYGLDENSQNFMNNYMSCRKQSTIVNGSCSPQEKISYGMAQSSIHGPLIFILYVNQCPKLRVHPAPGVHISTAGCTIFECVHPVCARILSHLLLLYIGRVHGAISGCTVLWEVHPASAQNKSLISDTVNDIVMSLDN